MREGTNLGLIGKSGHFVIARLVQGRPSGEEDRDCRVHGIKTPHEFRQPPKPPVALLRTFPVLSHYLFGFVRKRRETYLLQFRGLLNPSLLRQRGLLGPPSYRIAEVVRKISNFSTTVSRSRAVFARNSYHFSYFVCALASIFSACLNVRHPHKVDAVGCSSGCGGREGQTLWKTFM